MHVKSQAESMESHKVDTVLKGTPYQKTQIDQKGDAYHENSNGNAGQGAGKAGGDPR